MPISGVLFLGGGGGGGISVEIFFLASLETLRNNAVTIVQQLANSLMIVSCLSWTVGLTPTRL